MEWSPEAMLEQPATTLSADEFVSLVEYVEEGANLNVCGMVALNHQR